MRRSFLILVCLGAAMAFVVWISREVILPYYLLSIFWLIPLYYFLEEKAYPLLAFSSLLVLALHGWFFLVDPHPRIIALWVCQAFLFVGFCYYRWELKRFHERARESKENIRKNLESFQAKYQTRLHLLKNHTGRKAKTILYTPVSWLSEYRPFPCQNRVAKNRPHLFLLPTHDVRVSNPQNRCRRYHHPSHFPRS